ncbi:MAG: alpha/beta hydrolase [Anaerolineae bacterium]|nr:alpha/beta hydrolase [Anaerolineae bacterium]
MSAITIENDLVHYEVLGRGRPVILIHGWLGSWRYWIPAMRQLSMKYRTYALDLWGFGDSGKDARRYDFASQVMLLDQFMDKMGIAKAALVGHGLGASVVAHYAVEHPDHVPRLMAVCPPLFRMAPTTRPLTANPLPAGQLPAPGGDSLNAMAEMPTQRLPELDAIHTEAKTLPMRTEEMKARIRAALERRVHEEIEQAENSGDLLTSPLSVTGGRETATLPKPPLKDITGEPPKSPREAAAQPPDKPAVDVAGAQTRLTPPKITPPLPPSLPDIPVMPKADLAAGKSKGEVQRANPLKNHLKIYDPMALLEQHVPAGDDLEKLRTEVSKTDKAALQMSIESFDHVDTLRDLQALTIPVIAMFGAGDTFLPPPNNEMAADLKGERRTLHIIRLDSIHHFPMLEDIATFNRLVLDFLEAPDVTKVVPKKTWERRVR